MDRRELFDQIKAMRIARAYLFQGPEEYIKSSALRQIRAKLLPEGFEQFNEAILENVTAQTIIEACETLPLMGERRLVVVRDWAPLMSGKSRNEQEEGARMIEWLKNPPDSCTLIFYMRESIDGRKKTTQTIAKLVTTVQFDYADPSETLKWARNKLKPLRIAIEPAAVNQLIFMAGRALTRLDAELEKLAALVGENGVITDRYVDAVVAPSLESSVFQMIDRLMEKRMTEAMVIVKRMTESGESPFAIIAMLTRQLRMLLHIKSMSQNGEGLPAIEKALELNHYAATQAQRQANRFSVQSLEKGYRACVNADYSIKNGAMREDVALDMLIFSLQELT